MTYNSFLGVTLTYLNPVGVSVVSNGPTGLMVTYNLTPWVSGWLTTTPWAGLTVPQVSFGYSGSTDLLKHPHVGYAGVPFYQQILASLEVLEVVKPPSPLRFQALAGLFRLLPA